LVAKYLMALDAGSGGGKCFICDTEGHEVATSFKEWVRANWNPQLGWDILCTVTKDAMGKAEISADEIVGVSSTSMREEIVLLTKDGKELPSAATPEIMAVGMEMERKFGEEMYLVSGHWPIPVAMAPPKLVWLKRNRPQDFANVRTVLSINDWILYKLTGERASEPTGACETCLFDITKGEWSKKLLDDLDLPQDIFPKIRMNGKVLGEVTEEASKQTGLKKGTPVAMGGADTQCGLIGTAAVVEGVTTAVAGTTTPVQMVLSKPIFDPKWRMWTNCHAVPGQWILESNAGLTGWAYRWFKENLADVEEAASKVTGIDAYELMNREAESAPVGSGGIIASMGPMIMNTRYMRISPGALIGFMPYGTKITGKKEIVRAIIENTCYAVRGNCEQIEEISEIKIKELRFCGGSARSRLWAKIQADVLGIPVWVPEIKDATPFGAALCAGVGAGVYSDIKEATEATVRWETKAEPDKGNHNRYNELYKKWLRISDKLKDLIEMQDLLELMQSFFKKKE